MLNAHHHLRTQTLANRPIGAGPRHRGLAAWSAAAALALGGFALHPAAAQASHSLRIENDGSHMAYAIYISPSTSGSWGSDRLRGVLRPGYHVDYSVGPDCYYDVLVTYWNDSHRERYDAVDTCMEDIYLDY